MTNSQPFNADRPISYSNIRSVSLMSWWLLDRVKLIFKLKSLVMIILNLLPDNIHFFEITPFYLVLKISKVTKIFKLHRFLERYNSRPNINSKFHLNSSLF